MTMMTRDASTLACSADQQAQNCIVKQLDLRVSYPRSTHTRFFWFGLPVAFRLALVWSISWMTVSGSHASCVFQEFLFQLRFMKKESWSCTWRRLPNVNPSTTTWCGWKVSCKGQLSSGMKHEHKCTVSVLRVLLQELYWGYPPNAFLFPWVRHKLALMIFAYVHSSEWHDLWAEERNVKTGTSMT